ncbi:MAG: glycosyl hydrolase family 8 [Patescibacteria group bacterium]|jgi:endo-1,4-beta-D-glucanase Y
MNIIAKYSWLLVVIFFLPKAILAADFSSQRAGTWNTFKTNYIEAYKSYKAYGLVFDPSVSDSSKSDAGDYAVSEGVGYGLLLATLQNDQATFDKIFNAANQFMWNGTTYDWKISTAGEKWGTNGATDADEDIALALIIADKLQAKGTWTANSNYATWAQKLINMIYDKETTNSFLKPGDAWGGSDLLNLSYFAPAWYRMFDSYETTNHDWNAVIDKQYSILLSTSAKYNGLIPDWQDQYGNQVNGSWGMRYDGIRTPWRIAVDATVNNNTQAKQYLDTVIPYVMNKDGASGVQMYAVPSGNKIEYHNELAVAMWAAGARGASNTTYRDQLSLELEKMYMPSIQAFSNNWSQAYLYYFNQSLAMLGSAVADGSFQKLLNESIVTGGDIVPAQELTKHKRGIIQKRHVLVRAKQNGDQVTLRCFQTKKHQPKTQFCDKTYTESSLLKKINIKHHKIIIKHASGAKQVFSVALGLSIN